MSEIIKVPNIKYFKNILYFLFLYPIITSVIKTAPKINTDSALVMSNKQSIIVEIITLLLK